jgi:AcrR family transcriptional regulator
VEHSNSRDRVLDVAEELFSRHGYAAVTLRDIAARLELKVSSLYYYAPKGKEELYVAVLERNMQRHSQTLREVIHSKQGDWQAQLYAIAEWMLTQPPLDMRRVMHSDIHDLSHEARIRIMSSTYSVMQPIEEVFITAQQQSGKAMPHAGTLAATFLVLVNAFNEAPTPDSKYKTKLSSLNEIIEILIKGLLAD